MWTIFKVFIEFVTILLLFNVLVFWPGGMWDLSFPTREPPSLQGEIQTSRPLGKSQDIFIWTCTNQKICYFLKKIVTQNPLSKSEVMVGDACGGKPAAMEARQYCWVTCRGWPHHHSPSLSPQASIRQLNNREAGPSNAWDTELQSRAPPREPL